MERDRGRVRPALRVLPADAAREPARQRADGAAHGVRGAGGARAAERHAQLVPDRPRVVVRRRAGDRAGRARSGRTSSRAGEKRRGSSRLAPAAQAPGFTTMSTTTASRIAASIVADRHQAVQALPSTAGASGAAPRSAAGRELSATASVHECAAVAATTLRTHGQPRRLIQSSTRAALGRHGGSRSTS